MVRFDKVDTSTPRALERALEGLNVVLEEAGDTPLQVYIFNNALVVRRVTQSACDKPI